eukprot:7930052-Pyramimonas_sp.AAC.1
MAKPRLSAQREASSSSWTAKPSAVSWRATAIRAPSASSGEPAPVAWLSQYGSDTRPRDPIVGPG